MKKVFSLTDNGRTATVFYNGEWEEYIVQFKRGDKHIIAADYHTGDYDDAKNTATYFINNAK